MSTFSMVDVSAGARRSADIVEHHFDGVLIAAQAGSDWAWTLLYRAFGPPLRDRLLERGASDVEGLLGTIFAAVARDIATFSGAFGAFSSWVTAVADEVFDRHVSVESRHVGAAVEAVHAAAVAHCEPQSPRSRSVKPWRISSMSLASTAGVLAGLPAKALAATAAAAVTVGGLAVAGTLPDAATAGLTNAGEHAGFTVPARGEPAPALQAPAAQAGAEGVEHRSDRATQALQDAAAAKAAGQAKADAARAAAAQHRAAGQAKADAARADTTAAAGTAAVDGAAQAASARERRPDDAGTTAEPADAERATQARTDATARRDAGAARAADARD